MFESLTSGDLSGMLSAFLQVLMIDLVLAGDNAVAVGLAAAGLPQEQRKKVILWGLAAAVGLRVIFALITVQLLALVGLLLAGGVLLLWVCWKMWRDMRDHGHSDEAQGEAALDQAVGDGSPDVAVAAPRKTFKQAFLQIFIADVSMSLDNVLAVAGAAREHPVILVFGLLLSIALMGIAATWIAKLLHKHRWIGYVGLVIVLYVALHMMWEGHRDIAVDLGRVEQYNAAVPDFMDITPEEAAHFRGEDPPGAEH
jgi:YjbE family integral membrane protein